MWSLVLASWLSLAAVEVKVTPLAGEPVTGTLLRLSAEQLVLNTATGERPVDLKTITAIVRATELPKVSPVTDTRVTLLDGSVLIAESYAVRLGKAALRVAGGVPVEARTRSIRSVRFKAPLDVLEQAWQEMLDAPATGDVIVIRKTAAATSENEKPAAVLDRLAGVVQDVTADSVKFEFDSETIDVKREKLEGIIYYSPAARELAAPLCRLIDSAGSQWSVKTLRLEGEQIQLETVAGVTASLPVEMLRKLDFSVGNTNFLSDLEPDSVDWTPFIDSPTAQARLSKLYQPRKDMAFDGGRMQLNGQSFDKGLAIHSRTKLVYRVPKDAKKLMATVGIDDRVGDEGDVRLVISGDANVLLDRTITGKDAPLELSLDLTGVRRITILVDYGNEIDIGDHLNLCNARITK